MRVESSSHILSQSILATILRNKYNCYFHFMGDKLGYREDNKKSHNLQEMKPIFFFLFLLFSFHFIIINLTAIWLDLERSKESKELQQEHELRAIWSRWGGGVLSWAAEGMSGTQVKRIRAVHCRPWSFRWPAIPGPAGLHGICVLLHLPKDLLCSPSKFPDLAAQMSN